MRRYALPGLGLLAGVGIGLLAARLALGPHLLERYPAPGSSAASTAEIRLTFSQPMDPSSVSQHLHLAPTVDGEWHWEGRTMVFRPVEPWLAGTTVEVRLEAGARSTRNLKMLTASSWSFSVRAPRLAYLWPAGGAANIYALAPNTSEPARLTMTAQGVTDFGLGARGTRIAYATDASGSATLRALDVDAGMDRLLFTCPQGERCTSPTLSPSGTHLAFVREPANSPAGVPSAPRLTRVWMLDVGSGSLRAVSPEGDTARAPFWSPQGWLAYADSTRRALVVMDPLVTDPSAVLASLPSALVEPGVWSTDGRYLVYPDLLFPVEGESEVERAPALETHLFRWEVGTGALIDLSLAAGRRVEDAAPSFSSDGDWIYFSRRVLAASEWTPGRQLWRMRPDGSGSEALSDEPFINHGVPTPSPGMDLLVYLRFDTQAPLEPAGLWWFDLRQRRSSLAVEGGFLPTWIP